MADLPDREQTNTPRPTLGERIRDAIDRLGEWVDQVLNPPILVPIPVRRH